MEHVSQLASSVRAVPVRWDSSKASIKSFSGNCTRGMRAIHLQVALIVVHRRKFLSQVAESLLLLSQSLSAHLMVISVQQPSLGFLLSLASYL